MVNAADSLCKSLIYYFLKHRISLRWKQLQRSQSLKTVYVKCKKRNSDTKFELRLNVAVAIGTSLIGKRHTTLIGWSFSK